MENKYAFIQTAIGISNTVRATLGPKGMNKMVIDKNNSNPILTNDGATIIKNLAIDNPIAKMFKELAESQEIAIGDGTTTAVIIAGQLLENALSLLNRKIHPTTIITGYDLARTEAIKFVLNKQERTEKEKIIKTTFGSKIPEKISSKLISILKEVKDVNKLRIAKKINSSEESKLINGFVFDGHNMNERMPKEIEGNIAVVDMYNEDLEFAKFNITTTKELDKLEEYLKDKRKNFVNKLKENNVKALFITKTNPQIEALLTDAGIMEVVVYKKEYLDNICKATNSLIITDLKEIDISRYLGNARVKYERETGIIIENEKSQIETLLICGETNQVTEEIIRSVEDVLGILKNDEYAVIGAGAFEISLSLHLKKLSFNIGGKEQLAIESFSNAIENIPLILAENCGFDAIEVVALLKKLHQEGKKDYGVDAIKIISDARERGIYEPAKLKIHAINSATDVANLILKLDDIYYGKDKEDNNEIK